MAKYNTISADTSRQIGHNLSRISYDVRQEINAKVIGVLKYNNDIRNKLLKRNIGLYPNLNEGIGYISNFYSNESSKPFSLGEDGLLGYTHIFKSEYQSHINKKNGIGDEITYYQHLSQNDTNNLKWDGKYDDYTDYIDDVIGVPKDLTLNFLANIFQDSKLDRFEKIIGSEKENLTTASILRDILQYDNIKYAMEKTRIGTITPNPIASFTGAITTNINNFSGKDTSLGLITNYLYAAALKNGAHFNSLRKTKYITPNAYSNLGNKLSTLATIGTDFRIDDETGRIIADFNPGFTDNYEKKTLNDYNSEVSNVDAQRDIADTNHARYKNIVLNWSNPNNWPVNKKHFSPFIDSQYGYDNSQNHLNIFNTITNINFLNQTNKTYYIWNEGTKTNINTNFSTTNGYGTYSDIKYENVSDDLLYKTQELFAKKEINTLIGRFHTEATLNGKNETADLLQTAVTSFGLSHGRNLLTKKASKTNTTDENINGYDNPYCRVWTYHHQYDNIGNLIRPFGIETIEDDGSISTSKLSIDDLQKTWYHGRTKKGLDKLSYSTVVNSKGFVNIAPFFKTSQVSDNLQSGIKKCMFSIENLAWLDVPHNKKNLSDEQRGPNGGRIMWFPPYDLKFNENVNVNWGQAEFIGRGEKIYTYTNTERSGTLSFVLLVDHPSILDTWRKTRPYGNEDEDEQTLLRFFAGCEILSFDNKADLEAPKTPIPKPIPEIANIPPFIDNSKKVLTFNIYFPQNYSGFDDFNKAIEYLSEEYEINENAITKEYKVDKDTILPEKIANQKIDNSYFGLNKDSKPDENIYSFQYVVQNKKTLLDHKTVNRVSIKAYEDKINEESTITNTDKKKNDRDNLCERRAIFAKKFVQKKLDIDSDKIEITTTQPQEYDGVDSGNISSSEIKRIRCATINILYTDETYLLRDELTDWLLNTKKLPQDEIDMLSHKQLEDYQKEKEKEDKKIAKEAKKEAKRDARNKKKNERERRKKQRDCQKKNPKIDNCDEFKEEIDETINSTVQEAPTTNAMKEIATKNALANNRPKVIDGYTSYDESNASKYERWEDESDYFSLLKDNDSFLYSRLIDKIKYFTPAFHSITPEGFNARLSFLHQCTRQGNTYSASDKPSLKSAGNLAFGRPPICVLRIGDFYHTKIVIDSITIDYENPQWDMNPEGIGMQPMFARISLNFKFLGGSDIEAPISRLQNALSFNYYANQGIYDDRADSASYIDGKPIINGMPWKPVSE